MFSYQGTLKLRSRKSKLTDQNSPKMKVNQKKPQKQNKTKQNPFNSALYAFSNFIKNWEKSKIDL